jgi:hypothetical protein
VTIPKLFILSGFSVELPYLSPVTACKRAAGTISWLILLLTTAAFGQPDNRYCGPGDIAKFGAEKDGPAALPTRCINTALSSTPSPGNLIRVARRNDLQPALDRVSCGDTIRLEAGEIFAPFSLPAKKCDNDHWITVRSSAPDAELPPEGTRITPCYAGVASLRGRPKYSCSPKNVLARVELRNGGGAITFSSGSNHYRLIGLEVTRTPQTGITNALIRFENGVDHIVIDRSWVHGAEQDETMRGVYLGGSTSVAVIDSYFNDFHCTAMTGACTDAQAITGGNSTVPIGVYKIVNNYLEGAAENILFGGAAGSQIPADIEIRRNHLFKPLTWMPGSPDYIGTKFIVKNLFELKNAERVLFEGNVLENSWGGFSQVGHGILLTPRGTFAAIQDVTIRYNIIAHIGAGMQLAATRTADGNDSLAAQRWSIHDDILEDLNASAYNGAGVVFQISSGFKTNTPLNNVVLDHLTVAPSPVKTLMMVGVVPSSPRLPFNITFTNNIVPAGKYSVWSIGGRNCAKSGNPSFTFENCWSSFKVSNNVIVDYPTDQGPWPPGNFLTNAGSVGFTKPDPEGADYRLSSRSRYKGKSTDGRDVGADVDAVNAATAGVR